MFADISFPISSYQVFTYKIPNDLKSQLSIGMRVTAPLGSRNVKGIIVDIKTKTNFMGSIKSITNMVDGQPVLDKKLWQLIQWLSKYYNCPIGVSAKTVLPNNLSMKYKLKTQLYVKAINNDYDLLSRAKIQKGVYKYLKTKKTLVPVNSLMNLCSNPNDICKELYAKGFVELVKKPILPKLAGLTFDPIYKDIQFTKDQRLAIKNIFSAIDSNQFKSFLLHGVTGSGKTEIYIEAARHVLKKNKTVIILLPEIALTPQIAGRFKAVFGEEVAVWHSKLSQSARSWTWKKICLGEYKVVIGARSSIFVPLKNIGMIIVDEEQEDSYKQESPDPRYHARDVALIRGKINKATVVLSSATPSLESYYNSKIKKLDYIYLSQRFSGNYPTVDIVDMIKESKESGKYGEIFSKLLIEKIENRLSNEEQIILLHNRRGFSPAIKCDDCGEVCMCAHCKIALTFHSKGKYVQCHFCNQIQNSLPKGCLKCKSYNIQLSGTGTQKIEKILKNKFPNVSISRLDTDVARSGIDITNILQDFSNRKIDILLGTQMIAKGLDFANATLVGIINADTGLYLPDYRAGEKAFQLIYQSAGRSGRGKIPGEVVIQSYNPDNTVIEHAAKLELKKYYDVCLKERKSLDYPPFSWIVKLELRGTKKHQVENSINKITNSIKQMPKGIEKLGPAYCYREKLKDNYRMQIIFKSQKKYDPVGTRLQKFYNSIIMNSKINVSKNPRLIVDVNPTSLL